MSNSKPGRPRVLSDEVKSEFLDDYRGAKNISELAKKWGVHPRTAAKYLRQFGVQPTLGKKKGAHLRNDYHPKLGIWRDARVAEELGVSKQAVGCARRARGIEPPSVRALRLAEEGGD